MTVFDNAIYALEYWGVLDVILPFILIFTVAFAVLQKAKIFGDERRFNVIIALVLAMGVIMPHSLGYYPAEADVVNIINAALPGVSLVMVIIVMFLLLLGVLGGEPKWAGGSVGGILALIAIILVVAIFGNAAGWWELSGILEWLDDPEIQLLLITLSIMAIVLLVTLGPEDKTKGETFIEKLGDWFKK